MRDITKLTESECEAILHKQIEMALDGSEKMLIHLGQVYLGQNSKVIVKEEDEFDNISTADLQKRLLKAVK